MAGTADILLQWRNDETGALRVNLVRSPQGDILQVEGVARLVQIVTINLLNVLGANPFYVAEGNTLITLKGRPATATQLADIEAAVQQLQYNLLQLQQQAAAQGYLTVDEQLDHFENIEVSNVGGDAGQYAVTFTIITRANASVPFTSPVLVLA